MQFTTEITEARDPDAINKTEDEEHSATTIQTAYCKHDIRQLQDKLYSPMMALYFL